MIKKFAAFLIASVTLLASSIVSTPVRADDIIWKLHTATILHKTDGDNWQFLLGDYNHDGTQDLYVIKKQGEKSTEVHILNGKNNYQSFLLQTGTTLHKTDGSWQFMLGDYNHDGVLDLYGIKKQGVDSTEVHILNGANNFQNYILQTGTKLHKTDGSWQFALGDYNHDGNLDLYGIKQQGVSSTEVHVLNGGNNFQSFILQTGTILHKTDTYWRFLLGDYNSDGVLDVYAIKQQGEKSTEVHVLNGSNYFQNFLLQTATPLEKTDGNWQFALGKGRLDLYIIKQQGVSSTEVHEIGYNNSSNVSSVLSNFVATAQSQVGYVEGYENITKYGQWYGLDGNPWCAMFVSWCANQVGILNNTVPRYAGCAAGAQWYMDRGRYRTRGSGYVPKTGDVIFYNVSGGINHTGIVQNCASGIVYTIEGNCGDAVRQCSYDINNTYINGYGVN